jgi:hypothetical protein
MTEEINMFSKDLEESIKNEKRQKEVDPMIKDDLRNALSSLKEAVEYIEKNKAEDAIEFVNFCLSALAATKDRWQHEGVPKNHLNRMNLFFK